MTPVYLQAPAGFVGAMYRISAPMNNLCSPASYWPGIWRKRVRRKGRKHGGRLRDAVGRSIVICAVAMQGEPLTKEIAVSLISPAAARKFGWRSP